MNGSENNEKNVSEVEIGLADGESVRSIEGRLYIDVIEDYQDGKVTSRHFNVVIDTKEHTSELVSEDRLYPAICKAVKDLMESNAGVFTFNLAYEEGNYVDMANHILCWFDNIKDKREKITGEQFNAKIESMFDEKTRSRTVRIPSVGTDIQLCHVGRCMEKMSFKNVVDILDDAFPEIRKIINEYAFYEFTEVVE